MEKTTACKKRNYIIIMRELSFEWDHKKASGNILKHKVSFEEAVTVFGDDNAVLFYDPDHSDNEERFILLGLSRSLRLLVVCHCSKASDSIIRIFSARKADKAERHYYNYRR